MAKSILNVPGIGPSTTANLTAHGISTLEDLANATIEQLLAINGFQRIRAETVIRNAKTTLAALQPSKKRKSNKNKGKDPSAKKDKKEKGKNSKGNKKSNKQKKDKKKNKGKKKNKK